MTAVRKSVFGSAAERKHFGHLVEKWSKRSRVYHNLPFLQVFDLEKLVEDLHLDKIAVSRLKKTSIDFVLCDNNDTPWMAIDFDGLNQGFNSGATYVDGQKSDWWRKQIFNLKLNAAHRSGFPYVIVRSAQFKLLPGEAQLTVVDGVIGSVLANVRNRENWAKIDVTEHIPGLDKMSDAERSEAVQDLLIQVETVGEIENCPITARRWALFKKIGVTEYGHSPLQHKNARGVKAYVRAGSKKADARVWIPTFGAPKICEFGLLENLGYLVAAEKLAGELRQKSPK